MKKWIIISLTVVSLGFIALNGYLIAKKDSKVQHTVYVEDWTRVTKDDVVETFDTEGVMMPQEEYKIYFHEIDKEFQRFLVKEGDVVTAGTPLFEYITPELDKLRETLEAEKLQAEGEISGIDDYISTLLDYQASIPAPTEAVEEVFALEEGLEGGLKIEVDENASSEMIVSAIEQEIYKQELEKSKLEEEVKKYDSQLNTIDEQSGTAMIVSESDGIVKEVNEKLGNPVITIVSNVLSVEGLLTESQFKKAEMGMKFSADVNGEKKQLEGTLAKINPYPAKEPEVNKENHYQFEGDLTEQSETIAIGAKATVSVVTAEAIGVLTVPEKVIQEGKKPYVYQLNGNGLITKKTVQTGLGFNGIKEVTKGVEVKEVMMVSPENVPKNNAHFVTEMKPTRIKKDAFKEFSTRDKWEAFLIGLIEK
ncbi:efflux RND transporter periplasmic adaptor subunit [Metabacillus bambusae]|uniref:HlyD family efflux transporter periplasmic adaptor subunit n=1 Tax=Metabacillus bambusae TaxID=2795218 RepID=A0ABS3N0W9_9BACI|nr:HlyD family efflux transporter periplasmic adaptor subunit [Metabacillus bambusae]MBO1511804.1 HlyD family efflux transporter periplasmic adaptor subunit [Metabacillus bambusae]